MSGGACIGCGKALVKRGAIRCRACFVAHTSKVNDECAPRCGMGCGAKIHRENQTGVCRACLPAYRAELRRTGKCKSPKIDRQIRLERRELRERKAERERLRAALASAGLYGEALEAARALQDYRSTYSTVALEAEIVRQLRVGRR